jgi:hypothetical protein
MRTAAIRRNALTFSVSIWLAACGGSQSPIGTPGAMPQSRAVATHAERGQSWMLSEAKSEDLLYVSNQGPPDVLVLTYPGGKLVGTLKGLGRPYGLCVDSAQDVWVVSQLSSGAALLSEYAHAATKPSRVLSVALSQLACAVDPTTGNLAVVDPGESTSSSGGVVLYNLLAGNVTEYSETSMPYCYSAVYDSAGDLFVTGETAHYTTVLAEIPHGTTQFTNFPLDAYTSNDYDVLWDGKYVVVGDQFSGVAAALYRFLISGSTIKLEGKDELADEYGVDLFLATGKVVGGDWLVSDSDVYLWRYPGGGTPKETISKDVSEPASVAVSLAPK